MKTKVLSILSRGFILLSALSLFSVSLMAFNDPQSVMDLVQVKLTNTDAYSSIRGIYGGVGLSLVVSLIYLAWKEPQKGLLFLSILWGLYAVSRIITMTKEGPLGDFGTQWVIIESVFCLIATSLLLINKKARIPSKA